MKILQINKYHYVRGGSDKMYFDISALLNDYGHEVIHFSTKSPNNEYSRTADYFVDNPQFLDLPLSQKLIKSASYIYSKKVARRLDQLLTKEKPEIAHLHIFFGELSLSILPVLKRHKIPVVMSLHEYKILCPVYTLMDLKGEICELCCKGNYVSCITKRCNKNNLMFSVLAAAESYARDVLFSYEKHIDKFIAVSKFSMKKHLEFRPALSSKITYLYNFTDINDSLVTKFKGDEFLYFGRLSREKGLMTMLAAANKLRDINFLIVGEGPMRQEMEAYIEENQVTNVNLVGFKSGKELTDLICHARFSIVPSEWYETFGLTIVESMKFSTPVITSGMGGMSELVEDGETGFIFEAKNVDDLVSVIEKAKLLEEAEYNEMVANCNSFVKQNFNAENYYQGLISIYNEIKEAK